MALKNKRKFKQGIGRLPGNRRISFSKLLRQKGFHKWQKLSPQEKLDEKRRYLLFTLL